MQQCFFTKDKTGQEVQKCPHPLEPQTKMKLFPFCKLLSQMTVGEGKKNNQIKGL